MSPTTAPSVEYVAAQALEQTLEYAKNAADFAQDQLPLLAQDILLAGIISNSVEIGIFLVATVILGFGIRFCIKKMKKCEDEFEQTPWFIGCALGSVGIVVCVIQAVMAISNLLLAIYAPRLYIVQEVGKILN